jgi:arylsulfatase A-like enzyme
MRRALRTAASTPVLGLLVLILSSCEPGGPSREPWNVDVVLIVVDTLRADRLPFYGSQKDTAPFLSRLASQSVVFRHAHSPSSWTTPATASIFSSLHPFQHKALMGMVESQKLQIALNRIPDEIETIGELFKANGYTTFAVTDNVNICRAEGFDQGFDRFQNYDYQGADAINAKVIEWEQDIQSAPKSFLYLHYMDPHYPYNRRAPWFREQEDRATAWQTDQANQIEAYDSEIRYLDSRIQALFERFQWQEETLFILTSDHGEEFGEHGGVAHAWTLYAEVVDVPLLFHAPARWPRGRVLSQRVSTLDLLPTLAEILGFPANPDHEGTSLASSLDGDERPERDRILYSQLHRTISKSGDQQEELRVRSVIRGDWKLILPDSDQKLLFNLRRDPEEKINRRSAFPKISEALEGELIRLEMESKQYRGQTEQITLTPEQSQRLRDLGYGR